MEYKTIWGLSQNDNKIGIYNVFTKLNKTCFIDNDGLLVTCILKLYCNKIIKLC